MTENMTTRIDKRLDRIEKGIYGNGSAGLLERIVTLEVKFWILVILVLPISGWAVKNMVWG